MDAAFLRFLDSFVFLTGICRSAATRKAMINGIIGIMRYLTPAHTRISIIA